MLNICPLQVQAGYLLAPRSCFPHACSRFYGNPPFNISLRFLVLMVSCFFFFDRNLSDMQYLQRTSWGFRQSFENPRPPIDLVSGVDRPRTSLHSPRLSLKEKFDYSHLTFIQTCSLCALETRDRGSYRKPLLQIRFRRLWSSLNQSNDIIPLTKESEPVVQGLHASFVKSRVVGVGILRLQGWFAQPMASILPSKYYQELMVSDASIMTSTFAGPILLYLPRSRVCVCMRPRQFVRRGCLLW